MKRTVLTVMMAIAIGAAGSSRVAEAGKLAPDGDFRIEIRVEDGRREMDRLWEAAFSLLRGGAGIPVEEARLMVPVLDSDGLCEGLIGGVGATCRDRVIQDERDRLFRLETGLAAARRQWAEDCLASHPFQTTKCMTDMEEKANRAVLALDVIQAGLEHYPALHQASRQDCRSYIPHPYADENFRRNAEERVRMLRRQFDLLKKTLAADRRLVEEAAARDRQMREGRR